MRMSLFWDDGNDWAFKMLGSKHYKMKQLPFYTIVPGDVALYVKRLNQSNFKSF